MDIFTTLLIAIGLAMDAFAVSICAGTTAIVRSPRPVFRLAFHFGLFQGGMTLLGWLAGSSIAWIISSFDHWVALVLLLFVGSRMIRSGIHPGEDGVKTTGDPSKGGTLIMLSVATSIDAMAVGLGLAMLDTDVVSASLIIGFVTLFLSLLGLLVGRSLGNKFGKKMEIVGGLILIGIGIRILITHLFP